MISHGVESGIIQQLPNGGFIEVERPLTEAEMAAMVSPPPAPLELPQETDDNGLPEPASRNPVGKLQARAHDLFAEGISLAPPANGHGHGTRSPTATVRSRAASGPRSAAAGPARARLTTRPDSYIEGH